MQMLYNSDNFVVLRFEVAAQPMPDAAASGASTDPAQPAPGAHPAAAAAGPALAVRGGYEIVDKFTRKEIFIEGALADSFRQGVQALVEQGPDEEALDEFIGRYTVLAQQSVMLH